MGGGEISVSKIYHVKTFVRFYHSETQRCGIIGYTPTTFRESDVSSTVINSFSLAKINNSVMSIVKNDEINFGIQQEKI